MEDKQNENNKNNTKMRRMEVKMVKYKCGHETSGVIIMDSNIMSTTAYLQWAEEENNLETKEQCFDCYLNTLNAEEVS